MSNTIENNRLIRTFMGLIPKIVAPDVYSYTDGVFFTSRGSLESVSKSMDEYVKYHSDWNWLMEVVDKCLVICHNEMLYEWELSFSDCFFGRSIDKMYSEVVAFIHWYNQQKN